MKISASILDYSMSSLDLSIWDKELKLFAYQKDFLLRLLDQMYITYDLKRSETWVDDVVILGSLTTSKYLLSSDLDVHIRVNLEAFIATNMPGSTVEQAFEKLDTTRKEFDRAKILAPMTQHPVEFYFESVTLKPSNTELVGVYSILHDKWLKEPIIFEANLDFEESKRAVVEQAEALAQELDGSFGKIERNIQRVNELDQVIRSWGPDKQQLFYTKVEQKLNSIEQEIIKDLKIKQDLVDARHANQDATSDNEIFFKYLARNGFFAILSNLKTLMEQTGGQVTTQELPLIDKIISTSSIKEAAKAESYWVDPKGTIFQCDYDHGSWVLDNQTMLSDNYSLNLGLDNSVFEGLSEDDDEYQDAFELQSSDAVLKLISSGWTRVFKGDELGIQINDLMNPPSYMEGPFTQFASDSRGGIVVSDLNRKSVSVDPEYGFIKGIQKGLQSQRMGSLKEAFMKDAFDKQVETDICVDLDKTIAKAAKYPEIGEPIEGAKEGLQALKDLGYNIIIYSCRADSGEDVDLIKEYLDKHDLPYDSIFEGEKPFAKFYIDDHAIKFDSWDNVLKQVEKSEKKASLAITARLDQKYWIDSSGKEYPLNGLAHNEWILETIITDHSMYQTPEDAHLAADDKATEMLQGGWTRVTTETDYDFAMEVADINNLPSYLDNFVAHHYTGGGVEIDDLDGNYQDISDPFPSLRKAIYQAKRLRNAASLFSKRDIVAKTKKIKQGDYSCIMAMIPHGIAQEIVEFGVREIPDEDLYTDEDGNLGRELQAHVTIEYGLLTDDAKSVRRSFNDSKPFKAKLGKVRHFQPPERDFDVVTVEVVSDDLTEANKMIVDKFDCADDLPSSGQYKPHITVAYVKRNAAKKHIGSDEFEGIEVELDTLVFSPRVGNKTYFSIGVDKESFLLEKIKKTADFLPSLVNAPDNDWQFAEGGDDKEIALQPDSVSDDTTEAEPCTTGKPRTKEVWRQFISMFSNLFSKKDTRKIEAAEELVNVGTVNYGKYGTFNVEVPQDLLDQYFAIVIDMRKVLPARRSPTDEFLDSKHWKELDQTRANIHRQLADFAFNRLFPNKKNAGSKFDSVYAGILDVISEFIEAMVPRDDLPKEAAYDKELEDIEKNELGEDQTLLEYSKDFTDLNLKHGPHNTTWLNTTYQDQEPSKPLPVTYSPQTNEDNLDQNSPGGYPRRFMGKPKGEWFSNEGEANHILIDMLKNHHAAIDTLTIDIEADMTNAFWITPNGDTYTVRTVHSSRTTHDYWIREHLDMLKQQYGIEPHKDQWGSHLSSNDLIDQGWIRIGDASHAGWGISVKNLDNIPSSVDNCLAQFARDGDQITVEDNDNGAYEVIEWPVKSVQQAVNRARMVHASLNKQAGSQSASVPDYLCDEWKTEQINDDVDEAPYINHDQRDYPFGMHDSPENTSNNIGWPKDNQRAVVHLDTLENPAYRNNPFNMSEYWVTYYNSMPMSDGIEQLNDE